MTRAVLPVAVVIPCYKVKAQILTVIQKIGPEVNAIYVVDDRCPEYTGRHVESECIDARVQVIFNTENLGVGGATMAGYQRALADGAGIIIKLDGDDQMDPARIPSFIKPIQDGAADYTKGNRFFDLAFLSDMPRIRLFGNAVLSLVNKLSSGYWDVMDPTNGYTAIHATALRLIPLHKIERRYFFESDMLFRLNTIRAVVRDIPMSAHYADEKSSLNIPKVALEFPAKYFGCFTKRLFYNYFLRDFNAGTIQFLAGIISLAWGGIFGALHWRAGDLLGIPATSGTVMLAALPILIGFQFLIGALNYDIGNVPRNCLHKIME
jgi:dolichol-phosphate mannosyltransferase